MAKGKAASHNRSSRVVTTTGHGVGGRKTIHQAPANIMGSPQGRVSGTRPPIIQKAMHAGTKNSPGSKV